jgi:hypothetical protein
MTYQCLVLYYFYDRKAPFSRNNDFQKYHHLIYCFDIKTNPDSHYSKLSGKLIIIKVVLQMIEFII